MEIDKIYTINKAISGDKNAISQIIKEEFNNIYTTLYYLSNNSRDINDIAQIVLIKLSCKISQLKNASNFKSWLNQIIINSYYDFIRKNKKFDNIIYSDNENIFDSADNIANPQEQLLYTELDDVIRYSINNLPLHYKIPITLREVQGMSYSDISNLTNSSIGTVKSRIARARNMIQKNIDEYIRS